jgi:hypothetical protein
VTSLGSMEGGWTCSRRVGRTSEYQYCAVDGELRKYARALASLSSLMRPSSRASEPKSSFHLGMAVEMAS